MDIKARNTIYRFQNGSQLYGLATPKSDIDYFEVFLPSPEDLLGLKEVEIVDKSTKNSSEQRRNTKDDIDDTRYSLPAYLRLLLANNPNILETLFVPPTNADYFKHPILDPLLNNPQLLVCKRSYKSFCGYAISQEHKLTEKKARYEELNKAVTLFETVYAQDITKSTSKMSQELAVELNSTLKHYRGQKQNNESFHIGLPTQVIYQKIKEERDTYGWRVKTDTFLSLGYDCKFGHHLLRLYYEAEELLSTGKITFPFTGVAKEELLAVKQGQVDLASLMLKVKERKERVEEAFIRTHLPDEPDRDTINTYLINTLLDYIKRS